MNQEAIEGLVEKTPNLYIDYETTKGIAENIPNYQWFREKFTKCRDSFVGEIQNCMELQNLLTF